MASTAAGNAPEASPARSASLVALPDELIQRIFRLVYALEYPDWRPTVAAVPFARIRISRRIHSLAYPIWLDHLGCSSWFNKASCPAFFAAVIDVSDRWYQIRRINVGITDAEPSAYASVVRKLPSLQSFAIEWPARDSGAVPASLVDAIAQHKSLSTLQIGEGAVVESGSFDLSSTPIRELVLEQPRNVWSLFSNGAAKNLDVLELWRTDLCGEKIPWATLRVLRLPGNGRADVRVEGALAGVLRSLQEAAVPGVDLPLIKFELGMDNEHMLDEPEPDLGRTARYALLYGVLELARPVRVKVSDLMRPLDLPPPERPGPFTSVKHLELGARRPLFDPASLAAFDQFLPLFPSLSHLVLHDSHLDAPEQLVDDFVALPFARFGMRHPAFAALVTAVSSTSTLVLEYRPSGLQPSLHLTRPCADLDFAVDVVRSLR
ncbi:hypothetical protein JCM8208_007848 [Rhodotorula glutinis]